MTESDQIYDRIQQCRSEPDTATIVEILEIMLKMNSRIDNCERQLERRQENENT